MQHVRPSIVAYLSGHGFGHFTRSAAVLERLASRYSIHVRTSAQALLLARRAPWPASVTDVDVGPGVVQRGPLAVDLEATLAAVQQHIERLPQLVAAESAWLRHLAPRAVFADVPPLAFSAAAATGVPSLGMGNFTWSWIYQGYAHHHDAFAEAAARLREHEARATSFIALEGGGGVDHLPVCTSIAPVVRRPSAAFDGPEGRARLRRHLGIPDDERRPVVLVSFGGFGAELALRHAAARNTALRLLIVSGPPDLALPHARSVDPGEGDPGEGVRPAHLTLSSPSENSPGAPTEGVRPAHLTLSSPSETTAEGLSEGVGSAGLTPGPPSLSPTDAKCHVGGSDTYSQPLAPGPPSLSAPDDKCHMGGSDTFSQPLEPGSPLLSAPDDECHVGGSDTFSQPPAPGSPSLSAPDDKCRVGGSDTVSRPPPRVPFTHPDLVAAADCVISKPGYGTVAECLHRPTAFVHVPRGEFREYPGLVALIRRWLPQCALSVDDFLAGRWADAVASALASVPPERPAAGDGVAEAAAQLDALAADRVG